LTPTSLAVVLSRPKDHESTIMATPATSPSTPSDNTAQLAKDYLNGKPILAKIITTATTGDPTGIDDVLSKNGYNVTEEGANKVLSTVPPGPDFDIKMGKLFYPIDVGSMLKLCEVAGLYSFTSPPNMLSTKMRIDPLSGKYVVLVSLKQSSNAPDSTSTKSGNRTQLTAMGTSYSPTRDKVSNSPFRFHTTTVAFRNHILSRATVTPRYKLRASKLYLLQNSLPRSSSQKPLDGWTPA
jgi:hypothetical protein